jgi:myo-inositol-1(or 4)-monophosphatase
MADQDKLTFAISLAQKAGRLLLHSDRGIKTVKGSAGNFATVADLASERFLISAITKKFPSHKILSEETKSELDNPHLASSLWIIDPIDGTSNFFYGIPFFCVSIAYAEFGEVKIGVVCDPVREEVFYAKIGSGAYLDGEKISVQDKKDFSGTLVNIGSPYKFSDFEKGKPLMDKFYRKGARVRNFGAAALEAVYVAAGRLAFYGEWGQKAWDVAAAKLIVEEAGGTVKYSGGKSIFDAKGFTFIPKGLAEAVGKLIEK